MGKEIVQRNTALPAAFAGYGDAEDFGEFAGGVSSGFAILGYRGKVWRPKRHGEETIVENADGDPANSVEVVMVKGNPHPSKIFYASKFEPGSTEAPDCYSTDGIAPDAGIEDPQNDVCATCPKNVWGSAITPSGKKTRACSDVRRTVVVFAKDLEDNGVDATPFLMRVPAASLNPMKDYVEKGLKPRGIKPFMLVTRIGFDANVAHPQFTFKPVRMLTEDEAVAVIALRESPDIANILGGVGTTEHGGGASAAQAVTSSPAASKTASAPTPPPVAEEDEGGEDEEEDDLFAGLDDGEEEEAPKPEPEKPVKKVTKKKAAKKTAKKAETSQPAKDPASGESIDDLLDDLLGD